MKDEIWVSTFKRLHGRLLGLAGKLLRDDEEAQDILQEAFYRLWKNYRNLDSGVQAEALSVRTVRNLSISSLRSRRPVSSLDDMTPSDQPIAESDGSTEREEQLQVVEKLINERLSPLQGQIIRLRDVEGRSMEDIARRMGMEETAVRMNLSRARKTIRNLYQEIQS